MKFWQRLRAALAHAGMSQSRLARELGVKPQAIQHLCDPKKNAQGSTHTHAMARILGVSGQWLGEGTGTMLQGAPGGSLDLHLAGTDAPPPRPELPTAEERIRYAMESSGQKYAPPKQMETLERLMARPFEIARATGYEARWLATGEGPITQEEAAKDRPDLSDLKPDAKAAVKAVIDSHKDKGDRKATTRR